jgi:hypothetical protein
MNEKRYPDPLEALLILLSVFIGLLVVTELLRALFDLHSSNPETANKQLRYFFLFGTTLFFIIPFFYARMRNYDTRSLFRLRMVPLSVIILSLTGGLSLSVLIDEVDRLISMILPMPDWIDEMMQPLLVESTADWILAISGVVLAAGFAEESLFRGFIQVSLEKKGDVTRAVLFSAGTWALIHIVPYWAIQIFIIGVVFGYLSWRTGSIIPPAIMHAVYNLTALIYVNLEVYEQMDWYFRGDHVAPVPLVIAAGVFYYSMRQIIFIYRS